MTDCYQCYRCGMEFGSQAGVRLHLRKKHDGIKICDKCGNEIKILREMNHLQTDHGNELISSSSEECKKKSLAIARKDIWEKTGERLTYFSEPRTYQTCRTCRIKLSSAYQREEHERRSHKLTEYVRASMCCRMRAWNFLENVNPSRVTEFVESTVKLNSCGSSNCIDAVNVIVTFFLQELPINITHIVRGGSYGKSTCLREYSDLDLAVFMSEPSTCLADTTANVASHVDRLVDILHIFKLRLQQSELSTRILITHLTKFSLRLQYRCYNNEHIHHIDILPCVDLLGHTPTFGQKKAIYKKIEDCQDNGNLQIYNTALLQLQVDFVRRQSGRVRDLIRLVKYWKRSSVNPSIESSKYRRLPNSYTLELITIHVWEKEGKPVYFEILRAFKAVLQQLMDYGSICAVWTENYSYKSSWVQEMLKTQRPIVLDPANPMNNVCASSNAWDEIAYVAAQSLLKPIFKYAQ